MRYSGDGPEVRQAQRLMLLFLTAGDEIWEATAKAIGLEPSTDCGAREEQACLQLGMLWLQDPQIEALTEQIQRVATASMRVLRLRAVRVLGKFLASPIESQRYKAARDILKNTDPDIERLRAAAAGMGRVTPGDNPPSPGPRAVNGSAERERQKLRMVTKKALEGGK